MRREVIINNELTSVNYESFQIIQPHGKKISFANMPSFNGQNKLLCSLFRTELKIDDFLNIISCCVFEVNRFAVGLCLQ